LTDYPSGQNRQKKQPEGVLFSTGIAKYNCYCTRHKIISMLSRDGYSTFYSVITIFF